MAPSRKPIATKKRLAAIVAMSEDEFVLFALDHLRQTGECTVTTSTAWSDDLTTDQQQNIVQKFRQAADRIRQFDCDRFDNSMERVVRDSDIIGLDRIYHHKRTEEFKGPAELFEEEKNWERWHHKYFLKEGGRPCYNIDDLDAVAKNPELKYHITSPWMYYEAALHKDYYADARVFRKQHDHWARFRIWQRVNRNLYGRADPTYRVGTSGDDFGVPTLKWYKERAFVEFQRYERAVLSILKQYGISRPAALELRLNDQDELVTWQEYVSFIYLHLGWATQEMVDHRLNGEDFLENLRSSGHVPEGTTLKDVQSMMFDAWVRGPVLPIDDVRRSLQQQKEVLLKRLREAATEEAKSGVEEEIRLLDENYVANEQRERDLSEKCWELTYSPYETDWPWCIAARKVFCYERLAVWARDQIPLIRAELEGRKDCKECKARDQTPAATEQISTATEQIPTAVEQIPTAVEQIPTAVEQTHTVADQAPTATDQVPATTDQTPAATDQTPATTEQTPAVSDQSPVATDETGRDAPSNPMTAAENQESQVSPTEGNPAAPHNQILKRTTRDQAVQVDISTDSHAVENEITVDPLTSAAPKPGPVSEDPPRSRKRKVAAPVEAPRRSKRVATLKVKKEEEAAAAAREETEEQSQPPAKARKAKAAPKAKPKPTAAPKSTAKSKSKRK
ncbi:unnamed protein product [Clonostachys rhizophaga]|uniref:Uncharacterized protein n=1 Tax=Clonostachys rhizophaga TaxID=160324 RepID=A0A9N9YMC7_9HYPO|nr:unnamed protein product [Clonostachys rhizophaga]